MRRATRAGRSAADGVKASKAEDNAKTRAWLNRESTRPRWFRDLRLPEELSSSKTHLDQALSNKEASTTELRIMASEAVMSKDNTPVPSTEGATQGQTMPEAELDQMHSILDFIYDYRTPEYAHSNLHRYATLY
jgi:hypothetical protein